MTVVDESAVIGINSIQDSVGARVVRRGWVGLYGRPGVGGDGPFSGEPTSSSNPKWATVKARC